MSARWPRLSGRYLDEMDAGLVYDGPAAAETAPALARRALPEAGVRRRRAHGRARTTRPDTSTRCGPTRCFGQGPLLAPKQYVVPLRRRGEARAHGGGAPRPVVPGTSSTSLPASRRQLGYGADESQKAPAATHGRRDDPVGRGDAIRRQWRRQLAAGADSRRGSTLQGPTHASAGPPAFPHRAGVAQLGSISSMWPRELEIERKVGLGDVGKADAVGVAATVRSGTTVGAKGAAVGVSAGNEDRCMPRMRTLTPRSGTHARFRSYHAGPVHELRVAAKRSGDRRATRCPVPTTR